MLLLLFRNDGGGVTQSQPETLFARMWGQGQTSKPKPQPVEAVEVVQEVEREPVRESFPKQAEPTPTEIAAYSAMAAALVKADIKARLAEQIAQEQAALAVLALQAQAEAEEQAELELLLLLL